VRGARVLDWRLDGRQWIMGDDHTIADIASLGWVRNLIGFYGSRRPRRVRYVQAGLCMAGARPRTISGATRAGDSKAAVNTNISLFAPPLS